MLIYLYNLKLSLGTGTRVPVYTQKARVQHWFIYLFIIYCIQLYLFFFKKFLFIYYPAGIIYLFVHMCLLWARPRCSNIHTRYLIIWGVWCWMDWSSCSPISQQYIANYKIKLLTQLKLAICSKSHLSAVDAFKKDL